MSDSSDVDEDAGIVPTLEVILEGLKTAQERVKKLIASEKRVRRDDEEVATTLRKVRRTLETVQVDLVEVAAAPVPRQAPREVAKAAKKKRPQADLQEDSDRDEDERASLPEVDELGDEDVSKDRNKRAALEAPKAKTIGDGLAGRIGGRGVLVYFSLLNEKDGKDWICASRNGPLTVVRKTLVHVKYENLLEEERVWYLLQFEADVVRRFQINFPFLFANSGRDMMNTRQELLQDPANVTGLIDSLARQTGAIQAAAKTSPSLSAANNTALMLAASLHQTLSASNRLGEFAALLNDMCQRCDLKFSTMDRYRDVGKLMLRCNVIACLLPSFVALHREAVSALLDDNVVLQRLDAAFDDRIANDEAERDGRRLEDAPGEQAELNPEQQEQQAQRGDEELNREQAQRGDEELNREHSGEEDERGLNPEQGEQRGDEPNREQREQREQQGGRQQLEDQDELARELRLNVEEFGKHQHDERVEEEQVGNGQNEYEQMGHEQVGETNKKRGPEDEVEPTKSKKLAAVEEVPKLYLCSKCKSMIVKYWCDTGKNHSFCWKCNGFSSAPPAELCYPGTDTPIHSYVFCSKHLNEVESCQRTYGDYLLAIGDGLPLSLPDFVNSVQSQEAQAIVRIFLSHECQFTLDPIDPDGWCIFMSISQALRIDFADFLVEMKRFAREFLKTRENTACLSDPQGCRGLWSRLRADDNKTVQAFWDSEAADILIPMIAKYLNENGRRVQICVWQIEKGELKQSKYVYPEGEFETVVDLLKSNVIVEHYDLMRRK